MLAAPSFPALVAFYARTDAELPSLANPSVHLSVKITSAQGVIRAPEDNYDIKTIHMEGRSLIEGSEKSGLPSTCRKKTKEKIGQLIAAGWGWLSNCQRQQSLL